MAFGIDETGITIKRLADVRASMDANAKLELGPGFSIDNPTPEALLLGVAAGEVADLWEFGGQVYDSFDSNNAVGVPQDNLADLKGLTRLSAVSTRATVELLGTPGTVVVAGKRVSVGEGGDLYTVDADTTLVAGGASGDDGAPADVTAVETGALAGIGIDTIVDAVVGWAGVRDLTPPDSVPGRPVESAGLFAARMASSGQILARTPLEALRARLQEIDEVQSVRIIENTDDEPDPATGLPGHSFECVIYPDTVDSTTIAQTIFDNKDPTSWAFGSTTVDIVDSQGTTHEIGFEYASEVDIDVRVTRTVDSDYPADGDDQIETAVSAYLEALPVGSPYVYHHELVGAIAGKDDNGNDRIPGIVTLLVELRRGADPYATTNVAMGGAEKADTGTIQVL